jgi:hypothetical protein
MKFFASVSPAKVYSFASEKLKNPKSRGEFLRWI